MNWNYAILNNDELSATDKFVYHLLTECDDGIWTRRQIAGIAGITIAQVHKICTKFRSRKIPIGLN